MKAIRGQADLLSGLLFLIIGTAFLWIGRGYDFGSPLRMGPNFFPVMLASILSLIGAIISVRALMVDGDALEAMTIKGTVAVTGGTLLFGFLVLRAGLILSVVVLVLVTAFASVKFKWKTGLAMAAVLTAFCAAVFVYGLGLPLPLIGTWFMD
jgi:hypothetical protein